MPRRRGARKDCDRVCKSEDVNGYKGSMPVDEVLAYVQGAVASNSRINGDTRSGRSKRKDTVYNVQRMRKGAPNADMDQVHEKLEILPQDLVSNEDVSSIEAILQSGKSTVPNVTPKHASLQASSSISDSQHMDAWLSSEMAQHLTVHDDFNDYDLEQRKEREFVTVCKKKKQKLSTLPNSSPDKLLLPTDRLLELAQCVGKNVKTFNGVSGVMKQILNLNDVAVSRNSSELSFSHSVESDIDDLSHFVGEYLDGVAEGRCEVLVDAPVHWYDAREESASNSSCRSSTSSYDSLRCFDAYDCTVSNNVRHCSVGYDAETDLSVRGVPDGDEEVSDFESNQLSDRQRSFSGKNLSIDEKHLCLLHLMPATSSDLMKIPAFACDSSSLLPIELERAQPAGRCSSQKDASVQAVVFVDSVTRSSQLSAFTADVTFTYGCTVNEHLCDDGLCVNFACPFVSDICSFTHEGLPAVVDFHQASHESTHVEDGFTIKLNESNGEFSFVFNGLLTEDHSKSSQLPTNLRSFDMQKSSLSAARNTSKFSSKEARTFLNEAFEEVWSSMLKGQNGVVMYSTM